MKKLVLDANLLCLIVAGYYYPSAIGKHKRLRAYEHRDFERVIEVISEFDKVVTCPHVLAEASNLLCQTNENEKAALLTGLATLMQEMEESRPLSVFACGHSAFIRLGLTDAVLLTMEMTDAPLLTVDLDLTIAAQKDGRQAINYNWLRAGAYD